jgi:hypothetical protein
MDLTIYYQKIRTLEATIPDAFPVVMSLAAADGGKAGVPTEVTRGIAAKMIVEGQARPATAEEAKAFLALQEEAKRVADQMATASKVQLSVLTTADLNKLRDVAGSRKDSA